MQTIYPVTATESVVALIAYQLLIAGLVIVGILLARDTKKIAVAAYWVGDYLGINWGSLRV